MAESTTLTIPDVESFKRKALYWAHHFNSVCLLDSNHYPGDKYRTKNWLLAVDAVDELRVNPHPSVLRTSPLSQGEGRPDEQLFREKKQGNPSPKERGWGEDFERLKKFHTTCNSSIFGFLTYDLKNQIEKLESVHTDNLKFPEIYFFTPRYLFEISGNKLSLNRNYPETFEILELIEKTAVPDEKVITAVPDIKCSTTRKQYIKNVEQIKQQIAAGDYYELNYCLEFKAEGAEIEPVATFWSLNDKAKAPFSCFFKLNDKYLMCVSPERFLKKDGDKLISQPIKGTIKRGATEQENEALKNQLEHDEKERAENVMIVDLVRNDLARSSVAGSVKVEELFGIYGFNSVNQMISTVTSQIRGDVHFADAIKNAFPMGSMTGAPKIEVMRNIEHYENFKRGLYSGSVGYITPGGDFDFNVVIRSILYNASENYVSLPAGGAITYDSDPEKEYDEILLKAKGMMEVLQEK